MDSIATFSVRTFLTSPFMATLLCWCLLVCPTLGLAANAAPPQTQLSTHHADCPFAPDVETQAATDACYSCLAAEQIPVAPDQASYLPVIVPHCGPMEARARAAATPDHAIQPRHDPPSYLLHQTFLI